MSGNFDLIAHAYLLTIVCACGICGNFMLVFILLLSKNFWARLRPYMVFLACCDTLHLVSTWLIHSHPSLVAYGHLPDVLGSPYLYAYPLIYTTVYVSTTAHIWGTVALTIERYVAVCFPLKHRTINSTTMVAVMLTLVGVGSLCFSVPRYFELLVVAANNSMFELEYSATYYNSVYKTMYQLLSRLFISLICPLSIILILTICMLRAIGLATEPVRHLVSVAAAARESRLYNNSHNTPYAYHTVNVPSNRSYNFGRQLSFLSKRTSKTEHSETKANRSLIALLITSVLCFSLPTMADLVALVDESQTTLLDVLTTLANFTVCIDTASSFFIFALTNSQFRKQLHWSSWTKQCRSSRRDSCYSLSVYQGQTTLEMVSMQLGSSRLMMSNDSSGSKRSPPKNNSRVETTN